FSHARSDCGTSASSRTCLVIFANSAAAGIATLVTVPQAECEFHLSLADGSREPTPLMLAMKRFLPSVTTPPGYQPVGMKPSIRPLRSSKARALFPPLATKILPLATATALEALPKGRLGSGRTEYVRVTRLGDRSIALTVSELALATNNLSRCRSTSAGWRP